MHCDSFKAWLQILWHFGSSCCIPGFKRACYCFRQEITEEVLRPNHKRPGSSHLVHWNAHSQSPGLSILTLSHWRGWQSLLVKSAGTSLHVKNAWVWILVPPTMSCLTSEQLPLTSLCHSFFIIKWGEIIEWCTPPVLWPVPYTAV